MPSTASTVALTSAERRSAWTGICRAVYVQNLPAPIRYGLEKPGTHPRRSMRPRRSARSAALANGLRRRGARDRRRVVVPTSLGKIPPPFGDLLLSDPGICRLAPLSPGAFKWWHDVPLLRVLGHGDTAVASPLPVLRARNARHDRGEVAAISGCPPHRLSRSARRH